jgi:hypothetical protein
MSNLKSNNIRYRLYKFSLNIINLVKEVNEISKMIASSLITIKGKNKI